VAPLLIDGKLVSAEVMDEVAARVKALAARGVTPGLAVVLVGEDPASQSYVNMKEKDCERLGIRSFDHRLPADTSQADLDALIDELNADSEVHGILVQQPFPKHLDVEHVVARTDPAKDVDGFHPENLGRLVRGLRGHRACTPWGVMRLLDHYGIDPRGKRSVIVGRSLLVGKPMGLMLLERDATVTWCHSKTADLPARCREADILVAAIGRPKMIGPDFVKEGAVVIDVGINRTDAGMVGDVDFDAVADRCAAITPVPGGVGPMTRAMLMSNTLDAAEAAL
jgi:methylenetetrahydrofolate dehydrogenase (NADP+)/methenyltetrahydrofolate cyclohydrolase